MGILAAYIALTLIVLSREANDRSPSAKDLLLLVFAIGLVARTARHNSFAP